MARSNVARRESDFAWLSKVEQAETAHVLRMTARALGRKPADALEAYERGGLDVALTDLGLGAREAFFRQRALWRAGQCVLTSGC